MKISIGKARVESIDKLGAVLTQATTGNKDRQVLLEADRKVPYGQVAAVMAAIRAAGIEKVGMVMLEEESLEVTNGRYSRRNASFRPTGERRTDRENNFFLGMVGFSLVVHVIAAAIFSHNPTPAIPRRPPTVYVDLVMAPVANPQRGSAGAIRKIAAPVAAKRETSLPCLSCRQSRKGDGCRKRGKRSKKHPWSRMRGIAEAMAKMKQRKAEQDELKDDAGRHCRFEEKDNAASRQ